MEIIHCVYSDCFHARRRSYKSKFWKQFPPTPTQTFWLCTVLNFNLKKQFTKLHRFLPFSFGFPFSVIHVFCHLTMKAQISNLVCSANFELSCISSFHHLLSTDATKTLFSAFGLSHLDYCKSFLSRCPQYLLNKETAHLVLRVSKAEHISSHFASLYWLPIDSQIQYKLSSLCYNCINLTAPDCLIEFLRICNYKSTFISWYFQSLSLLCTHPLAWSEVIFWSCSVCLEHCSSQNQVIQHLNLRIIS